MTLVRRMIALCCPKHVAVAYQGTAPMFKPANGTISFEEAKQSLNRYTTTLHAITSAVIKLGKLSVVKPVFRGISGMKLPDKFWEPNNFGVKGGVEPAFM